MDQRHIGNTIRFGVYRLNLGRMLWDRASFGRRIGRRGMLWRWGLGLVLVLV